MTPSELLEHLQLTLSEAPAITPMVVMVGNSQLCNLSIDENELHRQPDSLALIGTIVGRIARGRGAELVALVLPRVSVSLVTITIVSARQHAAASAPWVPMLPGVGIFLPDEPSAEPFATEVMHQLCK